MPRITRESCRAAKACWSDEELAVVIPAAGLTPREAAGLESVSLADRAWALRDASGATDVTLRLVACRSARRALALVSDPDPRSVVAVDVAERFAQGEATAEELAAAYSAAASAYSAAYSAYSAYSAAAYSAYSAAASAAASAYSAAYSAYSAEVRRHINDLVELLEGQGDA